MSRGTARLGMGSDGDLSNLRPDSAHSKGIQRIEKAVVFL